MKYKLFTKLFLLLLSCNIFASSNQTYNISLNNETLDNGSATSISVNSTDIVYGGISLNYIKSSKIIQYDERKSIYPVYLFFGLKAPWKISPFIEIGGDLGEIIVDNIFGSDEENDKPNTIDYYYSAGIDYNINERYILNFYAKKYNFIFNDYINGTTIEKLYSSRPVSYGLGIIIQF